MTKILIDTRKALGLIDTDDSFDPELILHINAALGVLYQNGVGLPTVIADDTALWDSFKDPEQESVNAFMFESAKQYVFLRTKIVFDPPPPSSVSYVSGIIDETLWRITEAYNKYGREEVNDTISG